jgi:hypothetical protein
MVVLPTLVIPIIPHFNGMGLLCLGAKLPKLAIRQLAIGSSGSSRHFLLFLK